MDHLKEESLMYGFENSFIKKSANKYMKKMNQVEAIGIVALVSLAIFGITYGLYSVLLSAGPEVQLPSAEELKEGVSVEAVKANALNRREWADSFEKWFMSLRMRENIVFTTKFLHEGEVKLVKQFDEESRTLTDREGGHFEIDFACENRENLKHGSLKYDLENSHFQVRWGGKHYIDFNDAFDEVTGESEDENEPNNSWCTYKHETVGGFGKMKQTYSIRCKTVEHAETDVGKEFTDGFIFEYHAQKSRVNDYKSEV